MLQSAAVTARRLGDLVRQEEFVSWWGRRWASLEVLQGRFERAARLYGYADAHARPATWQSIFDPERYGQEPFLGEARGHLGEEAFELFQQEGASMPTTGVFEEAGLQSVAAQPPGTVGP